MPPVEIDDVKLKAIITRTEDGRKWEKRTNYEAPPPLLMLTTFESSPLCLAFIQRMEHHSAIADTPYLRYKPGVLAYCRQELHSPVPADATSRWHREDGKEILQIIHRHTTSIRQI